MTLSSSGGGVAPPRVVAGAVAAPIAATAAVRTALRLDGAMAQIQGPPGRDGGSVQASFIFNEPACTWHIVHNLGRRPRAVVCDSDGNEGLARVRHFDVNVLEIGFAAPTTGTAWLL